jgi:hypothetical protein
MSTISKSDGVINEIGDNYNLDKLLKNCVVKLG